jgi:hypothetical protein
MRLKAWNSLTALSTFKNEPLRFARLPPVRMSGYGKELSDLGIQEFVNAQLNRAPVGTDRDRDRRRAGFGGGSEFIGIGAHGDATGSPVARGSSVGCIGGAVLAPRHRVMASSS